MLLLWRAATPLGWCRRCPTAAAHNLYHHVLLTALPLAIDEGSGFQGRALRANGAAASTTS